ncbi:hypothetical protein GCM10011416_12880 [Polaribacter pacificus]|uniref:DUF4260 domain-containing protein n=1 Tax=Polaribacter pacificus TaxID=1775173 RepID=A0A917HXS3_9FLAO|nr:DUF4260 domain-containing protein [Polaribacter pacificus]GGG96507.1 hypothetical protein GCM10011416_12880 [Polaribacter pacificus]
MKLLLKLEELASLFLAIYLFNLLSYDWWWYAIFFLAPDISFVAYAINPKIGAFFYNLLHHKAVAIVVYFLGIYFLNEPLQFAGLVLFGHSSFDRVLGYGLKYSDSFNHTHLGLIKKE